MAQVQAANWPAERHSNLLRTVKHQCPVIKKRYRWRWNHRYRWGV